MRARLTIILLALGFTCYGVGVARSEPLRIALVIAQGQYADFPALSRCAPAAAAVRDSLRGSGFEVIERNNLGRGEFDTAIGVLARRIAAAPAAIGALYYCGYAAAFNNRSFLMPLSAVLTRDNDILTQGILLKSVIDSLVRRPDSAGLVLLDVFQPPNAPTGPMSQLVEHLPASSFAVIAATNQPGGGSGQTTLASGLRDELTARGAGVNSITDGLRRRLARETVTVQVVAAVANAAIATEKLPAPSEAVLAPTTAPPPEPPPPTSFRTPPPKHVMVAEEHMSENDRRQVQSMLAGIGYYSGRIDGVFGPETRAAIRRYQFELKAELSGRLTAEQATQLVNGIR